MKTTSSSDIQRDDGDGVDCEVLDHFISNVFGDKVCTPYPPTIEERPDNGEIHSNNVAMSTELHKQLIIKMITFSNNMEERHKKSLKHHSQAMLRTVLRYAQASKVALLLVVELVRKIAADIFCLIMHTDSQTLAPASNGITSAIARCMPDRSSMWRRTRRIHSDVTAMFRCRVCIETITLNNSLSDD